MERVLTIQQLEGLIAFCEYVYGRYGRFPAYVVVVLVSGRPMILGDTP